MKNADIIRYKAKEKFRKNRQSKLDKQRKNYKLNSNLKNEKVKQNYNTNIIMNRKRRRIRYLKNVDSEKIRQFEVRKTIRLLRNRITQHTL